MLQFCSRFNNGHDIFTVTWLLVKKDSTCGNKHVDTVSTRNVQACQIYCGNSGFRKLAYDHWEFDCDCCSEFSDLRNMNGRNVYQGNSSSTLLFFVIDLFHYLSLDYKTIMYILHYLLSSN